MDQIAVSTLPDNKAYRTEPGKMGPAPRASRVPDSGLSFPEVIDATSQNPHGLEPKPVSQASSKSGNEHFKLWEKDDFSFGDVVDIINPLQHLPIVSTLYRKMTNDKIGFAPRVIGGALWGRLGGFVSGLVNAASEWFTRKDIGDHVYTALFGPQPKSSAPIVVAQAVKGTISNEVASEGPIQEAQSSFPAFNDDGGFSPGPAFAHQLASAERPAPMAPVAATAASSYNQNSELIEADEPFRLRFPA